MMTKYKVGDVAALFSKPKEPTTGSGKKLQSLFQDFYSKKTKSAFQPSQNEIISLNKNVENNTNDHRVAKKGKKRKFSSLNDSKLSNSENVSENSSSKKFKESPKMEKNKSKMSVEKREKFMKKQDFPRKKNKKFEVKSFHTGNAFSKFEESANTEKRNELYAKQKDRPKGNKQNTHFMKKSKHQYISSGNGNNNKLSDESSFNSDDASIRKEVEEFLKNNSEKTQKMKSPQKEKLNWKEERGLKKSKFKADLSANKNDSEKNKKIPKQDESVKNNENKKSNFLNEKDFPRTKKANKVNSCSFNHNFSGKHIDSENDPESSASSWSKKMKPNKNNFKQNVAAKPSNGVTKSPNLKSAKVLDTVSDDNSQSKHNNEIIDNVKDKPFNNFSRKSKKRKAQKMSFNNGDAEKIEEVSNSNIFDNNAAEDFDNATAESNKKKFNIISQTQNSQVKVYEQIAPDFIKLSSPKKDDEEVLNRTLFVGNLPANTTRKAVKNLFSTFGEIEYIRFQGIETDKAKIFSANANKLLSAKYAADSVPGFVIFKDRQNAVQALSLSGSIFKGHHITVDFAMAPGSKKLYDDKRSIFIGNLPFDIKDESIWNAFMECGRIEAVRAVRDHATGIGKGFGYVLFSTAQAKENALALNNLQIEGRTIRIKAVDANKKTQKSSQSSFARDSFKSRAIRFKKRSTSNSRKTIKKLTMKEKTLHKKKKIASLLQKSMQ